LVVIPNGFDTDQFQPNGELRAAARRNWRCDEGDLVVGLVARFHPLKDHETFLRAAGLALQMEPRLRFVLYGDNVTPENSTLTGWAETAGVLDRCSFLGRETHVQQRLPGLDLLVSSSRSEAFPLVLGEAMACGVLCVATDVGDSALIVGDSARIVAAGDPAALARAMARTLRLSPKVRAALCGAGRRHIQAHFSLRQVANQYRNLYLEVAGLHRATQAC
jgi:glycosyltransferase involved in cell wall biosynthesis